MGGRESSPRRAGRSLEGGDHARDEVPCATPCLCVNPRRHCKPYDDHPVRDHPSASRNARVLVVLFSDPSGPGRSSQRMGGPALSCPSLHARSVCGLSAVPLLWPGGLRATEGGWRGVMGEGGRGLPLANRGAGTSEERWKQLLAPAPAGLGSWSRQLGQAGAPPTSRLP